MSRDENNSTLKTAASPKQGAGLRICMPSSRDLSRKAFQCGLYEAQDVLAETADVDLIALQPGPRFRRLEQWQRKYVFWDPTGRLVYANPGLQKVRLTREYDVFMAVCANHWDLYYLNAIEGWKDKCRTSVVWLAEIWASLIPKYKSWIHALNQFDHIFVSSSGSVRLLSETLGRECQWVPGAVDTLRFSPYPSPPARTVDVYSIGRRFEGIHLALLEGARRKEVFYVHDTCPIAEVDVYDHRQHRDLLANVAKRSRCFMVAPGKMNDTIEGKGQVEIGYRFYEGAAAGAVMIGEAPDCDEFREAFPWPEAVIPIRPDGSDVLDVVASLSSEPEWASAIGRRNVAGALLRHDWMHRWKEIFQLAGLEVSSGMVAREHKLRQMAEIALEGQPVDVLGLNI